MFGIRPWEMEDLTPGELAAIGDFLEQRAVAANG